MNVSLASESHDPMPITSFGLWIAGTQVTLLDSGGIAGPGISGKVTYDFPSKTLTLENATISVVQLSQYQDENAAIYAMDDLNIVLKGTNTINAGEYVGIYAGRNDYDLRDVSISGAGTLTVNNDAYLDSYGYQKYESSIIAEEFNINGSNVNLVGEVEAEGATIENSTMTLTEGIMIDRSSSSEVVGDVIFTNVNITSPGAYIAVDQIGGADWQLSPRLILNNCVIDMSYISGASVEPILVNGGEISALGISGGVEISGGVMNTKSLSGNTQISGNAQVTLERFGATYDSLNISGGTLLVDSTNLQGIYDHTAAIDVASFTMSGGMVTAIGPDCIGSDFELNSYGIRVNGHFWYETGDISITGGTLNAVGGKASGYSIGVYYDSYKPEEPAFEVKNATITATADEGALESYGIFSKEEIRIMDSTVTTKGGNNKNLGDSYGSYSSKQTHFEGDTIARLEGGNSNHTMNFAWNKSYQSQYSGVVSGDSKVTIGKSTMTPEESSIYVEDMGSLIFDQGAKLVAEDLYASGTANIVLSQGSFQTTSLRAASFGGNSVKLTWDAKDGADGYLIYGIHPNGTYSYIGMTTKGTTYTDTKASKTQYNYYWVYPYHKGDNGKMIVGGTAKYTYGRAL